MMEIPGSTGYEYAKFLLQDKQRELQLLEQRLRYALLQPHEYESCAVPWNRRLISLRPYCAARQSAGRILLWKAVQFEVPRTGLSATRGRKREK